nr:hypothetical protein [Tanacetum cinerariifolium]
VTAALAARDALRSTNGDDRHNSGTGIRRIERAARECTYIDFLKCQPLPFKGTEGVASLSQWMFAEEVDKIEKYVRGLPDMIYGSVVASKPKTMQEAIEIATELMDKKVLTFAERQKLGCYECGVQGHFKRECPKLKNNNNQGNQGGRNNAPARVYAVGSAGADPDANVVT